MYSTPKEATLTVNGKHIHYWEYGVNQGSPVVLIHGGFGDAQANWQPLLETLGLSYHVTAVDLPSFNTSAPLTPNTLENLLAWLDAFLDARGVEAAVLIGHSLGALVARLYAYRKPERVPALVLVDGGELPSSVPVARVLGKLPLVGGWMFSRLANTSISKTALAALFHDVKQIPDTYFSNVQHHKSGLAKLMQLVTTADYTGIGGPLVIPTLVVWGERDQLNTISGGQRLAKALNAKFTAISDCGHLPHLEYVDVFSAQVELFVKPFVRSTNSF